MHLFSVFAGDDRLSVAIDLKAPALGGAQPLHLARRCFKTSEGSDLFTSEEQVCFHDCRFAIVWLIVRPGVPYGLALAVRLAT